MNQEPLFFDDFREALRHVVATLGGPKAVGSRMRPDLKPEHAARWLNDCLNHDRREHLHLDQLLQLLRMGREGGAHAAMAYLADDAGYKATPVEPADEHSELMRQYVAAAKAMGEIAKRIEVVEQRGALKAVR